MAAHIATIYYSPQVGWENCPGLCYHHTGESHLEGTMNSKHNRYTKRERRSGPTAAASHFSKPCLKVSNGKWIVVSPYSICYIRLVSQTRVACLMACELMRCGKKCCILVLCLLERQGQSISKTLNVAHTHSSPHTYPCIDQSELFTEPRYQTPVPNIETIMQAWGVHVTALHNRYKKLNCIPLQ